jgi:hypothetical protein
MAVRAMLIAGFAAGLLGVRIGRTAGEGRGLPFGGALGGLQTLLQITDGLLQLVDKAILLCLSAAEFFVLGLQLLNRRHVHADLGSGKSRQLTEIIAVFVPGGKESLYKYLQ